MPRPPKTSRDCFLCCKDCPDRYPACSAHCERYAAGKAEKERIDTARYEAPAGTGGMLADIITKQGGSTANERYRPGGRH